MPDGELRFIEVDHGDGEIRVAVRVTGDPIDNRPAILWLNGFMSVMAGTKASALAHWAKSTNRRLIRFDHSGHGESDGDVRDGTISKWVAEAKAVVDAVVTGPVVIVGSSMGGWIALLLTRLMQNSGHADISGLVLIAPAADMTERLMWSQFPEDIKAQILSNGVYERPSAYGDGPYLITKNLIEDGRKHLLLDKPVQAPGKVRILHGMQDPDVPWQGSLDLVEKLDCDDTILHLIKGGDHRLSREKDIALLISVIEEFG